MGERLAYLPSAGFCLLVALFWISAKKYQPLLAWSVLVVLLAALGARTIIRNRDWRSNFSLYSAAYNVVPDSARVHANLGGFYMDSGQLDRARSELQTALHIYPPFPDALEFSGLVESRSGRDETALPFLQQALSYTRQDSPSYVPRAVNLAAMLVKLGKDEEALQVLNEVISRAPDNSRAWSNRAVVRYHRKDLVGARSDAQNALQTDPLNAQAGSLMATLNATHPSQ
jgi:protein O-mannosyl-transferase